MRPRRAQCGARWRDAAPATAGLRVRVRALGAHFVCGFLGCDARPFNPLSARFRA